MENRVNWSDQDWAQHLGTTVKELPHIREYVNDNYEAVTFRNESTQQYSVALYRYSMSPSGFKVLQLMAMSDKEFSESAKAIAYAKQHFIATLEMPEPLNKALNIPRKALQLLSIRER